MGFKQIETGWRDIFRTEVGPPKYKKNILMENDMRKCFIQEEQLNQQIIIRNSRRKYYKKQMVEKIQKRQNIRRNDNKQKIFVHLIRLGIQQ